MTAIPLPRSEPVTGWVMADHIARLYGEEFTRRAGALSPEAMTAVDEALRVALAL